MYFVFLCFYKNEINITNKKKKKQQDQGNKNWCCTENFVSLTNSNFRTTAFCFENKF